MPSDSFDHLHCTVAAVEDVYALLGICLVNDQLPVVCVVLYGPFAAQYQFRLGLCLSRSFAGCCSKTKIQ